ncbi:MAG: PorT family protein [Chitinophagaceae bacterium]|nr:PorT family protein [Chitinophagaceae bacterium]
MVILIFLRMKKILLLILVSGACFIAKAQDSTRVSATKKVELRKQPNDHFMLQFGIDKWGSTPDSISPKGLSRHFNIYFMLDKPFKTNPSMSLAFGAGIGSSNMFFDNTYIDLKSTGTTLPFRNVAVADHFKRYKLTTVFAEIPVELRYYKHPSDPDNSFKLAAGLKVGTLLKSYTKGVNLLDKAGTTIYGPKYVAKESNKRFINTTRIAFTGRVGYGNFSLDASYQLTNFLKTTAGPSIHPYTVGITLSGL